MWLTDKRGHVRQPCKSDALRVLCYQYGSESWPPRMQHSMCAFGLYRILASSLLPHFGSTCKTRPHGMIPPILCIAAGLALIVPMRVHIPCVLLAMMSTPLLRYQAKHM